MKIKGMSPLTLGFIVAGSLFFVIFAVVRNATANTGNVEAVTAQQYAAFQAAVVQRSESNILSAVGQDLPVFVVDTPPTPMATVTPQSIYPANPEWMETVTDEIGRKVVFVGAWFDCPFVNSASDDFFLSELGAVRVRNLREVCNGQ